VSLCSLEVEIELSSYRVQVTSLYHDPIGVDNRSPEVKFSNNIKYKRNYFIKLLFSVI